MDNLNITLTEARPHAFSFVTSRTALMLVNIQHSGNNASPATSRDVEPAARPVLTASRALGLYIIHIREGKQPGQAVTSSGQGDDQDIDDVLRPRPGELVVETRGKSVFWATSLHRQLMARGVTHLVLASATTELAVAMTACEASDRGFQCCTLSDCTNEFEGSSSLYGFTARGMELVEYGTTAMMTQQASPPAPWDGVSVDLDTLQTQYRRGGLSPVDVVHSVFERIKSYEKENPHAWILLRPRAQVVADAEALLAKYETTKDWKALPPFYGIPFAVKDSFDVEGLPTTAACPDFAYTATSTTPTVAACLEAGGLLIGKTNMDQLATGLSGCRSPHGIPASVFRHSGHKDDAYCTGGSSSGSAVVVGARLVTFALGTDTAGSGRVPAAYNGIVGFKPTKGTLSYRGVVACCRSIDTATILAPSVAEARRVWYIIDKYDPEDAFAKDPQALPLLLADPRGLQNAGFRYAIPPPSAMAAASMSPEYQTAFKKALKVVESIGGRAHELDDAAYKPFVDATDLLYNGTLVNERVACIGEDFIKKNIGRFHSVTRQLYQQVLDRKTPPWDVFKDQLVQAEATKLANRLLSRSNGHPGEKGGDDGATIDVLVVPTAPFHPMVAEMQADPIAMNAQLGVFTHFGNVLDLCAMSVPAGTVDGGMPFGLCFVCARGLDGRLFDIATAFEQEMGRVQ